MVPENHIDCPICKVRDEIVERTRGLMKSVLESHRESQESPYSFLVGAMSGMCTCTAQAVMVAIATLMAKHGRVISEEDLKDIGSRCDDKFTETLGVVLKAELKRLGYPVNEVDNIGFQDHKGSW